MNDIFHQVIVYFPQRVVSVCGVRTDLILSMLRWSDATGEHMMVRKVIEPVAEPNRSRPPEHSSQRIARCATEVQVRTHENPPGS